MNMSTFMLAAAFLAVALTVVSSPSADTECHSVLDFTIKGIDGKDVPLKNFAGKVIMIVNMFSKISVGGDDRHELYTFLTGKDTDPDFAGAIKWNFTKFLVDCNGKIINRFEPKTVPLDPDVVKAIEQAIAEKEK